MPQENRLHPRVRTDITAALTCALGQKADVIVRNISPGGMMIDGDILLKEQLALIENNSSNPTPVEISILIPLPGFSLPLQARCRLVFIRRLSQTEFNFGFRFFDISEQDAERLQEYVDRLLGNTE